MYLSGFHAIEEYLKHHGGGIAIYVSGSGKRISGIINLAQGRGVPIHRVSAGEIDRLAGSGDHKGIILAVSPVPSMGGEDDLRSMVSSLNPDRALVLILDEVTDPHNLGAIMRSADLFGVDCIVLPKRRNAGVNETVIKVSSGTAEFVRTLTVANLSRTMDYLKEANFWVYGADMGGQTAGDIDFHGRIALVLGSEGAGLSRLVRERCDSLVSIPTAGHIDSLNVSVAAGILMYEIRRQQGFE